jgi:hypothetical protein
MVSSLTKIGNRAYEMTGKTVISLNFDKFYSFYSFEDGKKILVLRSQEQFWIDMSHCPAFVTIFEHNLRVRQDAILFRVL